MFGGLFADTEVDLTQLRYSELQSMSDHDFAVVFWVQVEGSFTCVRNEPGALHSTDYSWTLDFCRLTDGKPDC